MLRSFLVLIIIVSAAAAIAQNRLVPGYVVLENSDTLKGFIQWKGFDTAPDRVYYTKDNSAKGKEYSVEDCKGFGTATEQYQRWVVKMDMSVMNTLDYVIHNPDSILTGKFFLKQVYKGNYLSLFKYYKGNESALIKPEKEKPHFFIYDNENIQELILSFKDPYKDIVIDANVYRYAGNLVQRQTKHIYRDQLCAYFDWTRERKLKRKINELEYSESALVRIVSAIDSKIK